jgi:hypothetical protein
MEGAVCLVMALPIAIPAALLGGLIAYSLRSTTASIYRGIETPPHAGVAPYAQLHPPHLDGFLVSQQGEFALEPLPDGGTRLHATTWYQHHLRPERYWRWGSDYIIHEVHGMVLENIRDRSTGH